MRLALLALVCAAQLAVPLWMVRRAESTLSEGAIYLFRTAPVDPVDMFRGRYVRLGFSDLSVARASLNLRRGDAVYALLDRDAEGFARIVDVVREAPSSGDYLSVTVGSVQKEEISFQLPTDRFYMQEALAPAAERAYGRLRGRPAWAEIRVRDGHAVISDVFIDGVRLAEIAQSELTVPPKGTTSPDR